MTKNIKTRKKTNNMIINVENEIKYDKIKQNKIDEILAEPKLEYGNTNPTNNDEKQAEK